MKKLNSFEFYIGNKSSEKLNLGSIEYENWFLFSSSKINSFIPEHTFIVLIFVAVVVDATLG